MYNALLVDDWILIQIIHQWDLIFVTSLLDRITKETEDEFDCTCSFLTKERVKDNETETEKKQEQEKETTPNLTVTAIPAMLPKKGIKIKKRSSDKWKTADEFRETYNTFMSTSTVETVSTIIIYHWLANDWLHDWIIG